MATYFERLRLGMQEAERLLLGVIPGAQYEWAPMDNGGSYPLLLVQGSRKVLLYRFSKDSLVAMSDDPHRAKVRELFLAELRQLQRA